MELCRPDVFPMHNRRKFDVVIRRCQDDLSRCRLGVIRMDEINKARFPDPLSEAVRLLYMELIPPHMWYTQVRRKSHDTSLQQIEAAVVAELFALCEEKMHAQTNAERGYTGLDFRDERLRKPKLVQVPHAITESADTR